MARPVVGELGALATLDRDQLHVFVAGPGTGEAIAVALPGRGWVLVDGCRTVDDHLGVELPLRWVVDRYREEDECVELMVLTHPHEDHADGFAELLWALQPLRVGVASPDPPHPTLRDLYAASVADEPFDPEQHRRGRQVEQAFKAMSAWEEARGRAVLPLHDGWTLELGSVVAHVRAPTATQLARRLQAADRTSVGRIANPMSLVLELRFGAARVVLGGDLPETQGGRPVPEGWSSVLERHPTLPGATGFKVPHHGSREALHAPVLRGDGYRSWWVTPYASQRLPRGQATEAQRVVEGMALLLEHQRRVQVTALPTGRAHQRHVPPPGHVTQSEWNEAFQAKDLGGVFAARALEIGPAPGCGPGEPIWCARFDAGGAWTGAWRGPVAMEVVRDRVGEPAAGGSDQAVE